MAKEINVLVTLQGDCCTKFPVSSERDLKKKEGDSTERIADSSKKLDVLSWCSKRPVLTIPNFIRAKSTEQCKNYEKEEKVRIYIPNLATLGIYNKLMGGVDKADMLLELCKNVKLQQNSMQFIFLLLQLLGRCFVK